MTTSETCKTTDCSEICESFVTCFSKMQEEALEKEANLMMKLKELQMKVEEQKHKLGELQEYQKEMEMKQRQEDTETKDLKHKMKLLREKNQNLESKINILKSKIEALKNFKPSPKDAAFLQTCRLKYQLYKNTTGVRWDYKSIPPQGYVVNKKTYYMKPFSLESPDEDKLWDEIAKASSADLSAFSCE